MLQWIHKQPGIPQKTVTSLIAGFVTVFCLYFLTFIVFVPEAQAQATAGEALVGGLNPLGQGGGLPATDIRVLIARVIQVALGLIGVVMVVLMLYAGWLWMTAGGNEEQIGRAKKVLTNSAIGLSIIISSYAITSFIISTLSKGATDISGAGDGTAGALTLENFSGSGGLGVILKDHYPARDQADVPRNSKIIITFRRPIKVDSFATNTNRSRDAQGNPLLGDCINIGATMNWETDCDRAILEDDYISIKRADTGEMIRGASLLATFTDGKVYTIVLRPFDNLGSDKTNVGYKVRLGKGLLRDDAANGNPPVFSARSNGDDFYEWQFTCNTTLDITPPLVQSVYPGDKAVEDKNTVIQISFSKPMDPTTIQGSFVNDGKDYYTLTGSSVFVKSGNATVPVGSFVLTNGYRTLEFTPTLACGKNACGRNIYCLPVCDKPGANCPTRQDAYELLLKAARTFSGTSFESIPFSGVMDVVGNALDGNRNGKVDAAPTTGSIFVEQKVPDNYAWSFVLRDSVDLVAPFITTVAPGLDAQYVGAQDPLKISFSKRMRIDPMYSIGIEEKPVKSIPLCRVPSVTFDDRAQTTLTTINHCAFLTTGRNYYYPVITSEVEDVNFNCMFPGKGPGGDNEITKKLQQSSRCEAGGTNCCPVGVNSPLCCNGKAVTGTLPAECLETLREQSI